MTLELMPILSPITAGTTVDIKFSVHENVEGDYRDYTGAVGTVTICPTHGESFEKTIELIPDASVPPQFKVTLEPADTADLDTPQRIRCYGDVLLSTGRTDKPRLMFDLVRGSCT